MITVYVLKHGHKILSAYTTAGEPVQVILDDLDSSKISEVEAYPNNPGSIQEMANDAAATYGDYRINVQGTPPTTGVSDGSGDCSSNRHPHSNLVGEKTA